MNHCRFTVFLVFVEKLMIISQDNVRLIFLLQQKYTKWEKKQQNSLVKTFKLQLPKKHDCCSKKHRSIEKKITSFYFLLRYDTTQ